MGRHNYPNISNTYTKILDLEQPRNRQLSEFTQKTESKLMASIDDRFQNVPERGHRNRYYDISSILEYFICSPQQILQIKNDRYDDGFICKRLFFESNNHSTLIAKIDEKTTEILKKIILDEYETISPKIE